MDKQYKKSNNTVLSRIKLACGGRVHNRKLTGNQVLGQYFDFFQQYKWNKKIKKGAKKIRQIHTNVSCFLDQSMTDRKTVQIDSMECFGKDN